MRCGFNTPKKFDEVMLVILLLLYQFRMPPNGSSLNLPGVRQDLFQIWIMAWNLAGCEAADTSRPSRFCLACSAINCHFESISLPPTACRAATFAAFVLILSSSSLLGCERLKMSGNGDTSQLRNQRRKVTLTFFGRLSSFSFSNSVAPLPSAYKDLVNQIDQLTH